MVAASWTPLHLAFSDSVHPVAAWVIYSVGDAICWLGILATLRTAVRLPGEAMLVAHPWAIFTTYLRSWLFLDVVSALPWHLLMSGSVIGPADDRHDEWRLLPFLLGT